jgi:MFS transporter, ACS family, glucarate transporter
MNSTIPIPIDIAASVATRTRYRVVAMAVVLAMVTYIDRVCISILAPDIMRDLSLSKWQMSFVFSTFALAYAAFEIPSAWWADRKGTRNVLTRIVVWWSSFTMATAASVGFASLLTVQFLFGAGEAGAWSSVARTFSRWIPRRERGTVQGIFFTGAHLGGGLTPLLVMFLLMFCNWRAIFVLFGMIGFVWAVVWFRWFRDDPEQHSQVNAAELAIIVAGREAPGSHSAGWDYWKRLLTSRNMLALCLMYFPNSFAFYFCITWLATYFHEKHGLTAASLGIFTGLPLVLSILSDLMGGLTTDWAVARFGARLGRSGVGCIAYVVAGLSMILATVFPQVMVAGLLISLATAASMFTLGAAWGTCIDIGGNHSAVVSAAMNTSGQIGSVLSPILVTLLVQECADWNAPLYLFGALFLFGAVCWCFIDPRRPVFAEATH